MTRLLAWLLASALLTGAAAAAQNERSANRKSKSTLDQELLKDLSDDPLTEDLLPKKESEPPAQRGESVDDEKPAAKEAAKNRRSSTKNGENPLDKQLLEGLTEGEDVGESGDPLVRVGEKMRQAGGLIRQAKSGESTQQLQEKIVADLEQLIKIARQQQQQQQSSSSSKQQTSRRQQVKQSKPSGPAGEQPNAGDAAKNSTERLGKNELRRPDMAEMNDAIKRVWGQLPEKEREQMLQNSIDQFLPKYELMIEAYFKSLVERQERSADK